MRLFLWMGLLACAVGAVPTAPGQSYFLALKSGYPTLGVSDLCFTSESAYFLSGRESSPTFLTLDEIESIQRDNQKEQWIGGAIGLGSYLALSLALYYGGGGNQPSGGFIDRRSQFILLGVLFAPLFSTFGSLLGEFLYSETLYQSTNPSRFELKKYLYACDDSLIFNPNSSTRNYRDYKPVIDAQRHQDSLVFQSFPHKYRLELATSQMLPQFRNSDREYWGLSLTRLVKPMNGNLYTATLGLSRIHQMEEDRNIFRAFCLFEKGFAFC